MKYEYATTRKLNNESIWENPNLNKVDQTKPLPPEGYGWELMDGFSDNTFLYWNWRREIPEFKAEKSTIMEIENG